MTTKWINTEKIKDENFSVKEGFDNGSLPKNPLEQFLQANPLKSIFDQEPINSRNLNEPFVDLNSIDDLNPIDDQDDIDNINPLGSPKFKGTKINNKSENALTINRDEKLINSILVSLFSLFITLYVSYNWYFNLSEGFSKRIEFYEKFNVVNYLYFFSEYFYKIVKFFDETITIKIPGLVKFFKGRDRTIFVLIFFISHYVVKSVISFLTRVYKYAKKYIETGKINLMKLIYDPKSKNIYISLLFVFYVFEGIVSSFKSGFIDKKMEGMVPPGAAEAAAGAAGAGAAAGLAGAAGGLAGAAGGLAGAAGGLAGAAGKLAGGAGAAGAAGEAGAAVGEADLNPSESFKEMLSAFKVANPLSYLIITLIRISIVYGPTVSFASTLFFLYFKFYSLLGVPYYLKFNTDPIDEANLYSGVREGSFIDMFRHIHAVMNVNHMIFEPNNDSEMWSKIKNNLEKFARGIFNNLPFLVMFFGLIRSVPSILKIYSPVYKWTGIAFVSAIVIGLFKFMLDENPKMYVLQEEIKNKLRESFSNVF
jgi:hypothetical protein